MNADAPTAGGEGEALLVNAWVVSDGNQHEFIEMIDGLFEHLRTRDGFVEGALLRGANPTRFISYTRLRTTRDRQRLFEDEEVRAFLDAVGAIARADLHSYDVVRSFAPATQGQAGGPGPGARPAPIGPQLFGSPT